MAHKTHVVPIDIRWGDSDRLGHVNNTRYFEYAQEARVRFYDECLFGVGVGPRDTVVLRKTDCEFIRQVTDESGPLAIELDVLHIGRTSYSMRHTIRDVNGDLCAVATAVLVGFDKDSGVSRPLNEYERNGLATFLVEESET